jgi:hypothetical protein
MKDLTHEISKMQTGFEQQRAEHEAGKITVDEIEAEARARTAGFEAELSQTPRVVSEKNEQVRSLEMDMRVWNEEQDFILRLQQEKESLFRRDERKSTILSSA